MADPHASSETDAHTALLCAKGLHDGAGNASRTLNITTMYTVKQLKEQLRAGQYAWPGGYPQYFIADDGDALSFDAVRENYRQVIEAIRDRDRNGWRIVGCNVNWEDANLYCAHTGQRIESAYAED